MSHRLIGNEANHPLAIVVESVASQLLMKHPAPIHLEVDIDLSLRLPVDSSSLSQLIDSLVRQAILEMADGGELTITACETATGVDIEIADTGCDVESRACKLPMIAAAMAAELTWQNCPQGGGAVTARLPIYHQAQRRAA
ncbi:HAMP domain-containing histidine kinase [Rhodopirellula sp. SWK7]|uniref:HAMP domain-containing histidine kinase n=1 Tax=Rhodopirellula sp. SWK7 TaxID=595460 RepID=UPI0002BE67CB|nr:HAMP domain-containing histidine kinase [Rhodopirellula sp. SWK7]EMI44449.1 two-component sensor histidine kinase [Rhodopirellula sp. SWK7]